MSDRRERLGFGRPSRLAAAAVAAAVCLTASGCSAASSLVHGAAAAQGPHAAAPTGVAASLGINRLQSLLPSPAGPPADPFQGTPANGWANGAAGIVLPEANPMGGFTTAQVEYAYQTTRKLLIAANLDKATLLGGAPTAFADLLTNQQRATFLSGLNKVGRDKQGYPLSTRSWIMSFAPGDAQLIGSVIKVHGTMHAVAVGDGNGSDELDVHLDYLFTYAVESPHQAGSWMRIVDEDQWTVEFGNWQGAATAFTPWVKDGGSVSGSMCGTTDGYQHPDYPNLRAAQPTPSGTPVNPYVLGQSSSAICRATTGT